MIAKNKTIDFLVVGTQKSGTTTVYHLLRSHPDIYMPRAKEVAFFACEGRDKYHKGVNWYLKEYFDFAKSGQLIGEASPQYMSCLYAAGRIAKHYPDARIVVLLRNPIDRLYSAYRMLIKLGLEKQPFAEVVEAAKQAPIHIGSDEYLEAFGGDNSSYYIRMGMYNQLLEPYLQHFGKDRVHIEFMENLHKNPADVMDRIYAFIGVDDKFISPLIGQRFHEGGTEAKFKMLTTLLKFGQMIKDYLPAPVRRRLYGVGYWLEQKNVAASEPEPMFKKDRETLAKIYHDEVQALQKNWGINPPWNDFR